VIHDEQEQGFKILLRTKCRHWQHYSL